MSTGILLTLDRKFPLFVAMPPKRTPKKKEASQPTTPATRRIPAPSSSRTRAASPRVEVSPTRGSQSVRGPAPSGRVNQPSPFAAGGGSFLGRSVPFRPAQGALRDLIDGSVDRRISVSDVLFLLGDSY